MQYTWKIESGPGLYRTLVIHHGRVTMQFKGLTFENGGAVRAIVEMGPGSNCAVTKAGQGIVARVRIADNGKIRFDIASRWFEFCLDIDRDDVFALADEMSRWARIDENHKLYKECQCRASKSNRIRKTRNI